MPALPALVRPAAKLPRRGAAARARRVLASGRSALRRSSAGWAAAAAGVALTTAVIGAVLHVGRIPNISLLYLFPVVAVAGVWGRWPAIAASCLSFITFDWFFVQPEHAFTIEDPAEWLALGVFLVAALYAAQLTALLRERAREAQRRAWEATTLRMLVTALAEAHDLTGVLAEARAQALAVFQCADCAIDLDPAAAAADGSAIVLPLRTPRGRLGVLRLAGLPADVGLGSDLAPLLHAFAGQVALAVERVRLQEGATQAEVLRRTDELRSALLSAVSHDLRTPLASIKAAATSLLQQDVTWSPAERDGFARGINSGVDRLNRLVTNLLDLSRIEAGALRLDLEPYLLDDLIGEAAAQARVLFGPHQLLVELPRDPAALPWVRVDPILVEQALVNLLENAAKFSPPGAPVVVRANASGDSVTVEVEDAGPGVPPELRERVFDRFYRREQPGRSGTGIGLAVCKGVVEAHGGRVWIASGARGGARVCFTLPAAPGEGAH